MDKGYAGISCNKHLFMPIKHDLTLAFDTERKAAAGNHLTAFV
jgi:hypothetical protein